MKKFLFIDNTTSQSTEANSYESADFISTSSGVADASKPILTNANGTVDISMIPVSSIDHGSLAGLGDDDHTQYILASGTRNFTGIVSYSSHPTFTVSTQLVDKKYVDDKVVGIEWQDSVIDRVTTPPVSPNTGDRYLVIATATGAFAGQEDKIATYNGTSWDFFTASTGTYVSVDSEVDGIYLFDGISWTKKSFENTTASTGLVKVGNDIRIAASAAGNGLSFTAGVFDVNVDNSTIEINSDALRVKASGITGNELNTSVAGNGLSGGGGSALSVNVDNSSIEINADTLRVKALGIKDTMIDFGLGANQVSAIDIPIADLGGYTAQTEVEGAIQELYGYLSEIGTIYNAGAGGITKGDLVYISSASTVLPLPIGASNYAIGVAMSTVSAGSPVKVLANDVILTGVLTGATAGTRYYWNGTGFQTSIPSGSGNRVWLVGVAKDSTSLHIQVEFLKVNA